MAATLSSADTGGGNIYVVLPDITTDLSVSAKTGAGNAVVSIPSGVSARIHATTGLGKVTMDARFSKIDNNTYKSADFDRAANKVEITISSGAGNVIVNTA
jgi:predicted membrane protein